MNIWVGRDEATWFIPPFSHWDGFIVIAVKGSVSDWACQMKVNGESWGVQPPVGLSGHEQLKRQSWNYWNSSFCLSCLKPGTLHRGHEQQNPHALLSLVRRCKFCIQTIHHFLHSRACFEQGLAKWEETLSIHPSALSLQRWTGAVKSSSNPKNHLSVVATLGPGAEGIKGHQFSSLDLRLPLPKSILQHLGKHFPTS